MTTFAQLRIPFPLFQASTDDAEEYTGLGTCSLCGKPNQHCFTLGIGGDIILPCPECTTPNALSADDRTDTPCLKCKTSIPFPDLTDDELQTCYACLRAGKAALSKDTELGMISWEYALNGITHGTPTLSHPDFKIIPKDDWTLAPSAAPLPRDFMLELLHTPTYATIQGEQWQFCCQQPMIFLGQWSRDDFSKHAPDHNGRRLFDQIIQDPQPGLWEDTLHDETGIYVFRCPKCSRQTAHWDIA